MRRSRECEAHERRVKVGEPVCVYRRRDRDAVGTMLAGSWIPAVVILAVLYVIMRGAL